MDFVVDVEADGQCPGLFSMVSFGAVCNKGGRVSTFYSDVLRPLDGASWDPAALAVSSVSREEQLSGLNAFVVMFDFRLWIEAQLTPGERAIFWSDNLAFDWQFINFYFHLTQQSNPFGYSGRRIGDFYAGVVKDVKAASKWKKLRTTKHTHHPVDDALGNLEALNKIKAMLKV